MYHKALKALSESKATNGFISVPTLELNIVMDEYGMSSFAAGKQYRSMHYIK
jgi:hypothetical protein